MKERLAILEEQSIEDEADLWQRSQLTAMLESTQKTIE